MIDLNDLPVFERVASLLSFSEAARTLGIPKSSVSRGIKRLEAELATQLFQRTTRETVLTAVGIILQERCKVLLGDLAQTLEYVGSINDGPRGCLRLSAGIGFGINVLSELLPNFTRRYPHVDVTLELSSLPVDLIGDRIDVAIRMGPMQDSQLVAKRLGVLHRYVCVSPSYLKEHGTPKTIEDLRQHDLIDMPMDNGSMPRLRFARDGAIVDHKQSPRISVNDALTIHKLILNGAGIGVTSGYLCAPHLASGELVRLFEDWTLAPVDVHAVFPSQRELSPMIRAFIDYISENSQAGRHWQNDPLADV